MVFQTVLNSRRRLFRSFHKRKEFLKNDMKGVDKKQDEMKKDLLVAEHMRDVYDLMEHYKKEPITKPEIKKHDIMVKVCVNFSDCR